jgi:hypothetical protein
MVLAVPRLFASPATIDRVSVVNHTSYAMDVQVTGTSDGGDLRFTKDDLARADWKIVIPASVGARLAAAGATPTPPPDF